MSFSELGIERNKAFSYYSISNIDIFYTGSSFLKSEFLNKFESYFLYLFIYYLLNKLNSMPICPFILVNINYNNYII